MSKSCILPLVLAVLMSGTNAAAEIQKEKIFVADLKKTMAYRKEGLVYGGDRTLNQTVIKDIRWASNKGFERIVIDLTATKSGSPPAVESGPYYEMALKPVQKRIVVSIWGKPQLAFDSRKVMAHFKKSALIQQVLLYPKLEDQLWTFAIDFKHDAVVEMFELRSPVRLILDVRLAFKK